MILLKRNILYVQIDADAISVRTSRNGQVSAMRPMAALNERNRIVAVDDFATQAVSQNPTLLLGTPFSHPRLWMSDYPLALALVGFCLFRLKLPLQLQKPHIIIHPHRLAVHDLTAIEVAVGVTLANELGAGMSYVWVGRPLSEEEQRLLQFPVGEGRVFRDSSELSRSP